MLNRIKKSIKCQSLNLLYKKSYQIRNSLMVSHGICLQRNTIHNMPCFQTIRPNIVYERFVEYSSLDLHVRTILKTITKRDRFHRDLNSDRWIQSPEC